MPNKMSDSRPRGKAQLLFLAEVSRFAVALTIFAEALARKRLILHVRDAGDWGKAAVVPTKAVSVASDL